MNVFLHIHSDLMYFSFAYMLIAFITTYAYNYPPHNMFSFPAPQCIYIVCDTMCL